MFKHNILLFFRTIKRQKSSFLINIIGLSAGLASAILIALWVNDELSIDKFYADHERIYQVIEHLDFNDGMQTIIETSGPVAEVMAEEMPEVEFATATIQPAWFGKHVLSVGEHTTKAMGQIASEDYFNIFPLDFLQGNPKEVLVDPNSIVLSQKLAHTLFGAMENSIGQVVEFEHKKQFRVSGIFEDVPTNATTQFDFVLSSEASKEDAPWNSLHTWNGSGPQVYVKVKEGTNIQELNAKVQMIRKKRDENTPRMATLIPFSEHYLHGTYAHGKQQGGRIEYVRLFSIIAILILIIACINFMNLSTARASRRLKEIGVKKAVGAKRGTFVAQFLGESIMMSVIALLIAVGIVALFLPHFNTIIGKQLTLNFNTEVTLMALGITLFTGLVSGSYPALYLSGFNALTVLKGTLNRSLGELWTRKGLVVVQFTLSIILIVSVMVVYKQIEFVQNQNLGYEKDHIVHFNVEGKIKEGLGTFVAELKKLPGVTNASSTTHSMVGHNWSTSLDWEGREENQDLTFQIVGVDYDFIETMGMKMKSGHSFSREFGSDSTGVIFNEAAIRAMGLENTVGKTIENGRNRIIGVVKDFHFKSLHEKVEPLFMAMMPNNVKNVMVRIEAGKEYESLRAIQDFYIAFNPGFPFEYEFLDDNYSALYASEQRVSTLSRYFAGMAILISCLGLFGLAIFTAERRKKEIGIRKVLGQSASQVAVMLSNEFAKLVMLSILIALPIAYLLASNWLSGFAYRIPLRFWYFMSAGLVAFIVALVTVGSQAIRAANRNPVNALRNE